MTKHRQPGTDSRAEYEELYNRHHRDIWAVAYARIGDGHLATEMMQDAFLRLWKIFNGDRPESPKAWLVTVVRHLAEDEAKSSFRRNGTISPDLIVGVLTKRDGPEENAIRNERKAIIRNALQDLTPIDREILTLKYALERETEEIAEILGIQTSAVYMRLSRARDNLAGHLGVLSE